MPKDTKRKKVVDEDPDSDEDFAPSPSPSPSAADVKKKKKKSSSNGAKKPKVDDGESGDAEPNGPKNKELTAEYGVDLSAVDQSHELTQKYSAMKTDELSAWLKVSSSSVRVFIPLPEKKEKKNSTTKKLSVVLVRVCCDDP